VPQDTTLVLCVQWTTSLRHSFSEKQKNALTIIARQVSALLELSVKNKQALKQSDKLVAEEKKIVEQTLTELDEEKNFIANELHENFAQTLGCYQALPGFRRAVKGT
jgi:nitrate/nitrite-specific signal transduction histidine kinase